MLTNLNRKYSLNPIFIILYDTVVIAYTRQHNLLNFNISRRNNSL